MATGDREANDLEQIDRLGKSRIPSLVFEFAIPSIVGMLVNGAYGLIDSIFLGHGVGEIGLSTLTISNPFMSILMGLAMLIGAGGNALCALRLGEGKHNEAERIFGNTVMIGIAASILIAVLMQIPACIGLILDISSATGEVRPHASLFIRIIAAGCVFQILSMGLNNFIRTCGNPNRALSTMVVGFVACTAFNALFVLILDWGVAGSAFATILGQAASCMSILWYFAKTPGTPLRLKRIHLRLDAAIVKEILIMGSAPCLVQIGAAICQFSLNVVLVTYGTLSPVGATNVLAIIGVSQRIGSFSVLPMTGIAVAIQPILGYNYGARLWNRVLETTKVGILSATGIGLALWAALMAFAPELAVAFGISDSRLIQEAAFVIRATLFLLPGIALQIVGPSYFQATGQPLKSIVLTVSRQILILVPLLFFLPEILPTIFSNMTALDAVYFSMPIADFLAIFAVSVFLVIEWRKLKSLKVAQ